MRKVTTILSNDRIDKHGERILLPVLKSMRDQTNAKIMGSHHEHDSRNPPIARVAKAYILNEGGVNNLYGEVEFFESIDIGKEHNIKNKKLTLHRESEFTLSYDRSYEINGLKKDVEELQSLISNERPMFELKKSVEPISVLTIFLGALTFAGTAFVGGVLKQAGADFWVKLKEITQKNSKINNEEKLYTFIAIIRNDYYKVEVNINFTNPENFNMRDVLQNNSDIIDKKINEYYEKEIRVRKIVFNSSGESILHEYSVYKSGVPFDIRDMKKYNQLINQNRNKV